MTLQKKNKFMNSSKIHVGSELPWALLRATDLKFIWCRITIPPMQPDWTWSLLTVHQRMQSMQSCYTASPVKSTLSETLIGRWFECQKLSSTWVPRPDTCCSRDTLVHLTWRLLTHRYWLVTFGLETKIIFLVILKEALLLPSDWLRLYKASTDPNLQLDLGMCHLQGWAQFTLVFSRHLEVLI